MSAETIGIPGAAPRPTRRKAWKVACCLLAIFACGAVLGSLVTLRVLRREVARRGNPANWPILALSRLDSRLSLTPEQHRQIEPILRSASEEAAGIRKRSFREIGEVVRRAQAQAGQGLSADQQRRLDEYVNERAALARRWIGPPVPAAYVVPGASPSPASSPAAP